MTIFAAIIAAVLAFLVFRFVAGLVKFALLALIIIVALWFVVGKPQGAANSAPAVAAAGGHR
jgi:hypothetical protein